VFEWELWFGTGARRSYPAVLEGMRNAIVAPLVLTADFGRVSEAEAAVYAAGAEWPHLDIIPAVLEKVRRTKEQIENRPIELEVDGGVRIETESSIIGAGAAVRLAGSAVHEGGPAAYAKNIADVKGGHRLS